jgi:hypothetical protein
MKLLEFSNYEVRPTEEALLVRPIRRLYNADRSKTKEKFFQQISYMFFMVDPRSTYSYIIDLEERHKQIVLQEGLPENFKPSAELTEAMEIYKTHTVTSSSRLLASTRVAVDALSDELNSTRERLQERTDKGAAVTKTNDVMATLERVLKFIPQLQDLERRVEAELKEGARAKGGENTMFEDGI